MNDSVEPEKRPHMPACTNQNSSLSRSFSSIGPAALVEVAHHDRHAEAAEEHLVVVEPEPAADQVEAGVDVLGGALQAVLDLLGALVVQELELRLAGQDRVHRAQQPVEVEVVIGLAPTP